METTLNIDPILLQELSRFYGKIFNLPPLASKIYAYLIFDAKQKGVTFDEFVATFSASKSSVSTALSFLLASNLILDSNKMDERKRYFMINSNYPKLRFGEILQRLETEVQLVSKLQNHFKNDYQTNENLKSYQSVLEKNIVTIKESLVKL